jgi:hypothetical protein
VAVIGAGGTFIDVLRLASVGHTGPLVTLINEPSTVRSHQAFHTAAKARAATTTPTGDIIINGAHGDVPIFKGVIKTITTAIHRAPIITRGTTGQAGVDAAVVVRATTFTSVAAIANRRGRVLVVDATV